MQSKPEVNRKPPLMQVASVQDHDHRVANPDAQQGVT